MAAADDVVENETGDAPKDVVGWRRWWDQTRAAKNDREVDVADEAEFPLALDQVLHERAKEANEEEVQQAVEQSAAGELQPRPDDAPDNGSRAEHLRRGADEAVLLVSGAHVLDVGEHPGLDTELDGTGDDGGDDLRPEHGAGAVRWDTTVRHCGCAS